jgi:hypothetical protein
MTTALTRIAGSRTRIFVPDQLALSFEEENEEVPLVVEETPSLKGLEARARALAAKLAAVIGTPVRLHVTDNRHTVLSSKRHADRFVVRAHHMFLRGDDATWDALGKYLRSGRKPAARAVDAFVAAHRHLLGPARERAVPLRARGRVHDLESIRDDLAARFFGGALDVRITWGRAPTKRSRKKRRSIQLGLYTPEERLVRIHPRLDQEWVPRYFVESIVFHELLHHVTPPLHVGGKRYVHTREFRLRERLFPHFEEARIWEEQNLDRLLAADVVVRKGIPKNETRARGQAT